MLKALRAWCWAILALLPVLAWSAEPTLRGTGDLGVIIERGAGRVLIVNTSGNSIISRVDGLGDLSHASVVFSRDERYAYVFGRDGGLSKVDILRGTLEKRIVQGGNSIGGAISQDGRLVAVANYEPGGLKVFAADTLEPVADIPAAMATASCRKWSASPICRATVSSIPCSTPTKSGSLTCAIPKRPRSKSSTTSAARPTMGW